MKVCTGFSNGFSIANSFILINDPDPEFFGQISLYLGLFEKTTKREDGWIVNFLGIELDSDAINKSEHSPECKLQTFFGTDSLPELEGDTSLQSTSSNSLPLSPESLHSRHPSHFSRTRTPTQSRRHRRRPLKATSLHYAATMSTSYFQHHTSFVLSNSQHLPFFLTKSL